MKESNLITLFESFLRKEGEGLEGFQLHPTPHF